MSCRIDKVTPFLFPDLFYLQIPSILPSNKLESFYEIRYIEISICQKIEDTGSNNVEKH